MSDNVNKGSKSKYKKIVGCLFFIFLLVIGVTLFFVHKEMELQKEEQRQEELRKKEEERRIALFTDIKDSYNEYVKTNKEAKLYSLNDNNYVEAGLVGKDIELSLEDMDITYQTEYFLVDGLDLYIHYEDVEKIDSLPQKEDVYKNYVLFNYDAVTTDKTSFYDDAGLVYQINKGVSLPVIIKDTDKYYVEYNDRLLYIKKSDAKLVESSNTKEKVRDNIRTLTYHTIYNVETQKCNNTVICHSIEQFDSHMKYLSENDYFTLRMEDLELFLDGKIRIPKKSIVITLDDGAYAKNAVNIVEKYKVYATYFIITSRYDVSKIKSTYMNFESHTDNLHNNWKCTGGNQGGQLLCEDKDKVLEDLKTSQEKLGGATAFAYPFFDFNDRAIELLKESGFTMAFIGQYDSDGYSTLKTNKMLLRRKTIFSYDSIDTFISYLA